MQPMPSTRLRGRRISSRSGFVCCGRSRLVTNKKPWAALVTAWAKVSKKVIFPRPCSQRRVCPVGSTTAISSLSRSSVFRVLIWLISSMPHPCSCASMSKEGSPLTSVAVVMTARAPTAKAQRSANSLAPPRWPERSEMANFPVSSITTTAGSVSLDCSSGAIMRTTIPVAMISTKPSYSPQSVAISSFNSVGSKRRQSSPPSPE